MSNPFAGAARRAARLGLFVLALCGFQAAHAKDASPAMAVPSMTISDASVVEGDSGVRAMTFRVSLSSPAPTTVFFDRATGGGTATGNGDYTSAFGWGWSIPQGETFIDLTIDILGDSQVESNETFQLTLSNVQGATLADGVGVGTILNDDGGANKPSLSIADVSIAEGDSGSKVMTFTVQLTQAAPAPVEFDVISSDGAATSNIDFISVQFNHRSIPAGNNSATISVTINGDTSIETDENFEIKVLNVSGAYVVDDIATGIIANDDGVPGPSLSVNDVSISEGNSGTKTATFTVSLSSPLSVAASFDIATADDTATAGSDYVAKSLAGQSIPAGQTSKTFTVTINGDATFESDETFMVNLSHPVNTNIADGQGVGTIANDDQNPTPTISIADTSVVEGDSGSKQMVFTISLDHSWANTVTFSAETQGGTANVFDYDPTVTRDITIPAGQTSATFSVNIIGDTIPEPDETVNVVIGNVTGDPIYGDGQAVGTIVNNDTGGPSLSIGDVTISEGDSGTKNLLFTINLSGPVSQDVWFDIATADGTATAGSDYQAESRTFQRIGTGETSALVAVAIYGDTDAESDESFTISLSNVVNAVVSDGTAVATITNDDAPATPALSIGDVSIVEGNSGTKTATFTVSLSPAHTSAVSFDIATANGSATAGSDYVAKSTTGVSIAAGQTSKTFTVTINGDTAQEPDETFTVNLANASGATIADGQAQGTITNDDGGSGPTISISDGSLVEGNSGSSFMEFLVSLSAPSASNITFNGSTADGSASGSSDYVPQNWGLSFPAGSTSFALVVPITGDTLPEGSETFTIDLSNASGATFADAQGVGTIMDDDGGAGPTLSINDVTISEGNSGTKLATFTVTLSAAQPNAVFLDAATSNGSATSGSDYVAKALTGQRIAAGATTKSFTVTINGDSTAEPDETFLVNLSNAVGATLFDANGVGTITNDDATAVPTISIGDVQGFEGDNGTIDLIFDVTLSSAAQVSFDVSTSNGTATAGSDYVAVNLVGEQITGGTVHVVRVTLNGDTAIESDETFTVNLSNVVGATVADGQAVGTIKNDDGGGGSPTLTISDMQIAESNSGSHSAVFTVSLSAVAPTDVTYSVATANGTATAGSDYVASSLTGQVIPQGTLTKSFVVTINGDTTVEPDETFTATISSVVGAGISDDTATGTITNDDAGGPTLSINDVSVAEGNSGTKTLSFTVNLSAAQAGPVFFDAATANGTATAGSDYVAKALTGQRIAAGATTKAFTVTINGDTTQESDETFTVNLSNPVGASIADGVGQGTITNDDAAATPTLSIADASVSEGNSGTKTLTFTVSLSPAAAGPVTYNIATSNGTATSGSDYVAASLTGETIAAGGTSKTFVVTINGDTTNESDETFNVTLTNVSGATLGDGTAVGTITNDDGGGGGLTLSIGDVTISEGNSLTKQATFTVTLSAPAPAKVTYNIATADGTALAGTDYTTKSLTGQAILAGASSKTFVVVIKGDTVAEPNETFLVNVSGVTGATLADGQAIGTITNDDAALMRVARFDAQGLVDDIDDGNRQPQVSAQEYALLLADTASKLCARTDAATIVGVDGVEHRAVLADLADAASATCARTRYQAVMAEGGETGFLVEEKAGVEVLGKPTLDSLKVQGADHAGPITLLLPRALSPNAIERTAQLRELGARVQGELKSDPRARLVLIGGVTVPGLQDLTVRSLPAKSKLPAERVLASPALLEEFGKAGVAFPKTPANEMPAQVLELH